MSAFFCHSPAQLLGGIASRPFHSRNAATCSAGPRLVPPASGPCCFFYSDRFYSDRRARGIAWRLGSGHHPTARGGGVPQTSRRTRFRRSACAVAFSDIPGRGHDRNGSAPSSLSELADGPIFRPSAGAGCRFSRGSVMPKFASREDDERVLMMIEARVEGVPSPQAAAHFGMSSEYFRVMTQRVRAADIKESGEPSEDVQEAYW